MIKKPGWVLKRRLWNARIPTNDDFGGIIMVYPGFNEPRRRAECDALLSNGSAGLTTGA